MPQVEKIFEAYKIETTTLTTKCLVRAYSFMKSF